MLQVVEYFVFTVRPNKSFRLLVNAKGVQGLEALIDLYNHDFLQGSPWIHF